MQDTVEKRIVLTLRFTILGILTGIILSWNLWISAHSYPLIPIFKFIGVVPFPADHFLVIGFCLALIFLFIFPQKKFLSTISIALLTVLIIFDQSRLQPWVFMYGALLFVLHSYSHSNTEKSFSLLTICRIIIAGIYLWSGIQKFNPYFFDQVFPWLIEPFVKHPSTLLIQMAAFSTPLIEIGIGVGLLTVRFRKYAVILAGIMCAFVLGSIGPWGHNWNTIVWPWNIALVALVSTLFWKSADPIILNRSWQFREWIMIVLFCVLPALNLFGKWDAYLSASLYSGTTTQAFISLPSTTSSQNISISDWSLQELNVPSYPETRIYRSVFQEVCRTNRNDEKLLLTIHTYPFWHDKKVTEFRCTDQ